MKKKLILIYGILCLGFSFLSIKIGFLSTSYSLKETAQNQSSYNLNIYKNRANIYDKNFNKLVNQDSQYIATFFPTDDNIESIVDSIGINHRGKIIESLNNKKPISIPIENNIINKNIDIFNKINRYSSNQILSHIIGHLDNNGNGATGIEKSFNNFLNNNSTSKSIKYYKDAKGNIISNNKSKISKQSENNAGVVLTIDKKIQTIIEDIGEKTIQKGAIVIMDPFNGDIVGSASFPSFSPNNLTKYINDKENTPMINRSLTPFSAGSTFKIVTTAIALESGIKKDRQYNCVGQITVENHIIKCHNINGHGKINMEQALSVSCNPYFIDMIFELDPEKIVSISNRLSFGQGYNLTETMQTSKGYFPSILDLQDKIEMANLSFGQGKLLVTPIQIAQLISSIVNNGNTPIPSIVKGLSNDGESISILSKKQPQIIAINSKTSTTIQNFLINNIMDNSMQKAKPKTISAGGKTSTAQTGIFKNNPNGNQEKIEIVQTWFGGFFPAENPKYVCVILVEDGDTGNNSAAPIFSEIADKINLNYLIY